MHLGDIASPWGNPLGDPEEGDPFLLPLLGAALKFLAPVVLPAVGGWVAGKVSEALGGGIATDPVESGLMPSATLATDPLAERIMEEEEEDFEEAEEGGPSLEQRRLDYLTGRGRVMRPAVMPEQGAEFIRGGVFRPFREGR